MALSTLSKLSRFFHSRKDEVVTTNIDTDEIFEETPTKDLQLDEKYEDILSIDYKVLYNQKDTQARKYERLYKVKVAECQDHLERISLFSKQVDECVVKLDSTAFSRSVLSDKNINDYLEINRLIKTNKFEKVFNYGRHLKTIKFLFVGITYGVIPLVFKQSSQLTKKQRSLIKLVDKKGVIDIKHLCKKYSSEIVAIFSIIEETLVFLKKVSDNVSFQK